MVGGLNKYSLEIQKEIYNVCDFRCPKVMKWNQTKKL